MRQRVMRIRDADLGVGAVARLPRQLERHHTGDVALHRQDLQVEHQLRVFGIGGWNANRAIEVGQRLLGRAGLRLLNPALDFADRLEILVDPGAVLGTEPCLQPADVVTNRIEEAGALLQRGATLCRCSAFAKQALEHDARMRLGRQRRRR